MATADAEHVALEELHFTFARVRDVGSSLRTGRSTYYISHFHVHLHVCVCCHLQLCACIQDEMAANADMTHEMAALATILIPHEQLATPASDVEVLATLRAAGGVSLRSVSSAHRMPLGASVNGSSSSSFSGGIVDDTVATTSSGALPSVADTASACPPALQRKDGHSSTVSGRELRRLLCGVPTTLNSQLTLAEVNTLFEDFDIRDTDTIVLHDFYTRLRGGAVSSRAADHGSSEKQSATASATAH